MGLFPCRDEFKITSDGVPAGKASDTATAPPAPAGRAGGVAAGSALTT
ncbi:MAG TPA: hypothetical protein VIP46_21795 [Pyrinomonadaceae bacterium]